MKRPAPFRGKPGDPVLVWAGAFGGLDGWPSARDPWVPCFVLSASPSEVSVQATCLPLQPLQLAIPSPWLRTPPKLSANSV
jgi:hypothetical protein